jgi:hypothetical protein
MKETIPMTQLDRDLDAIQYGNAPTPPPIRLHQGEQLVLPDPDVLAHTQFLGAVDRLHEDKTGYPRFNELASVHGMTGSFAPEEVIMCAGDVGNGKSLLCQNLFDDQVEHDVPTLYIGTEQSPEVLKIKHACIRAGVSPRLMLKPNPEDLVTTAYQAAREEVQRELKVIDSEFRGLAFYATTEYVNQAELTRWITGGVREYGIAFVIVDHIDQVEHGPGLNAPGELTGTVQLLHRLARQHSMPIFVASQIKRRSGDPLAAFAPPSVHDFAGASGKERVMALGLGVWRPLRIDLSVKQLRELKKETALGKKSGDRIYQQDTMGVRLLKDRLGSCPGTQVFLHVGKGGRLSDDPATTHGIRTGGLS